MPDNNQICPHCQRRMGDHTLDEWVKCLEDAGMNYVLPHEDIPGGPMRMSGVEGYVVGEVSVAAAMLGTPIGTMPCLRFIFVGPGDSPMSRAPLEPIHLIMDEDGLASFAELVNSAVKSAISHAKMKRFNDGD